MIKFVNSSLWLEIQKESDNQSYLIVCYCDWIYHHHIDSSSCVLMLDVHYECAQLSILILPDLIFHELFGPASCVLFV